MTSAKCAFAGKRNEDENEDGNANETSEANCFAAEVNRIRILRSCSDPDLSDQYDLLLS